MGGQSVFLGVGGQLVFQLVQSPENQPSSGYENPGQENMAQVRLGGSVQPPKRFFVYTNTVSTSATKLSKITKLVSKAGLLGFFVWKCRC